MVTAFASATGVLAMIAAARRYPESALQILGFGVLSSCSVNAAAVALGSIAGVGSKDQGSVSAAFSTTTDVVVAAVLFGLALAFGLASNTVRRAG